MPLLTRRGFLGWSGLAGGGVWALLKPPPGYGRPHPTTTTVVSGDGGTYHDLYRDTY